MIRIKRMEADNELSAILQRRQNLNEALDVGQPVEHKMVKVKTKDYWNISYSIAKLDSFFDIS